MRLGIYTTRVTETDNNETLETKKDSNNSHLMTDNVKTTNIKRTVHPVFLLINHRSGRALYNFDGS